MAALTRFVPSTALGLVLAACTSAPASEPLPVPGADASTGGSEPDGGSPGGAGGSAGGGGGGGGAGGTAPAWPEGFVPTEPHLPAGLLCDIPPDYVQNGGDPVHPLCALEAAQYSDRDRFDVPATLTLATWNVEYGKDAGAVASALATEPGLAQVDILLLQEVPRLDQESDPPQINLGLQLAQQLSMNYVFAVEWDRRLDADGGGEHGLSVLSKYPIGNASLIRHAPCWDHYAEKGHFGGRATLAVDLVLGDRRVRVYDMHLATRDVTGNCRQAQGLEVLDDAHQPGQPEVQLAGGDLNTFLCTPFLSHCNDLGWAEDVIVTILNDGWLDLLPTFTSWTQMGLDLLPQRLDWLFAKQVAPDGFAVLQQVDGADHAPVVATFSLF